MSFYINDPITDEWLITIVLANALSFVYDDEVHHLESLNWVALSCTNTLAVLSQN